MTDARRWHAVATIEANGEAAGPFRLGLHEAVTIGRSDRAGLQSPSPRIEVPRELARLRHTSIGWVLQNYGATVGRQPTPVRVVGPEIDAHAGALFAPHAWVLLGPGAWTLEWDVGVRVTVRLRPLEVGELILREAIDRRNRYGGMATVAPEELALSALERRSMVAMFAYRIRRDPEPRDFYAEAARLLDPNPATRADTRALVKSQFRKIVTRINRRRHSGGAFSPLVPDTVGRYLVDLTETIGLEDLEDYPTAGT